MIFRRHACELLLLACAVLLPSAGCEPATSPAAASRDRQQLQGTWKVVSATFDGADAARGPGDLYIFEGDSVTKQFLLDGELVNLGVMTYELRPDENPKQLDLIATGDDDRVLYIYRFDGPKLILCMEGNRVRPTQFVARRGDDQLLLELERVSKEVAEPAKQDEPAQDAKSTPEE